MDRPQQVQIEAGTTVGTTSVARTPTRVREGVLHRGAVRRRTRDSWRRRSLAIADAVALLTALLVVSALEPYGASWYDALLLLPVLPLWIALHKALGLYDHDAKRIHQSTLNELPQMLHATTLGTGVAFLVGPEIADLHFERSQVLLGWLLVLTLTPGARWTARWVVRRRFAPERMLIIGAGHVARTVATKIAAHPEYGAELVGYVDTGQADDPDAGSGLARMGTVSEFAAVCDAHDVERVVIAFADIAHEELLDLIRMAKRRGLKVSVVPRLFEVIGPSAEVDQIEGMTLLGVPQLSLSRSSLFTKRCIDVLGAGLGLLALAPLMAMCALAVRLSSRGPVFFGQPRIGRSDTTFRMWKFRTMVEGADAMKADLAHLNEMVGGPMFKITADPRVTPVGRLLRAASLDELPQLWNVLRGEMSLVGPRPLVPFEDGHVTGWHRARLDLQPGLTGPWQVLGRNAISFEEMVKLDYLYVADWSLWNDVKLMLRTLPLLIFRRGT
jgi:exopolysaccharide biosynthesis polyprenyl glycosylphosphotransferase